jgi:hypothetical protein
LNQSNDSWDKKKRVKEKCSCCTVAMYPKDFPTLSIGRLNTTYLFHKKARFQVLCCLHFFPDASLYSIIHLDNRKRTKSGRGVEEETSPFV